MRVQDEIQAYRRIRKALAGMLGDAERRTLTWANAMKTLETMRDLAHERERALIVEIQGVEQSCYCPECTCGNCAKERNRRQQPKKGVK